MSKKLEDIDVKEIWEEYQKGLDHKSAIGLDAKISECIDFYEGRQWKPATDRTKSLPRPVVNVVNMIVDSKKSAMNNSPVKIVYEADNDDTAISFTRFSDYICKEMGMDELDDEALSDGALTGNYVKHYYWDTQAKGKKGNADGAIRCEIIDIRNIVFANPTQRDEQKQKYIIVATREEVESVKEYAKASGISKTDIENIIPDEKVNGFEEEESDKTKLVTILTKYFKVDGEVFCIKCTRDVIVKPAFALSLDLDKAKRDLGYIDEANTTSPDNPNESVQDNGTKATLYPINVASYKKKKGSIYGISEAEGLIANQKCVNFHIAMLLFAQQQMAWAKWIVKPDALKGQKINNEAGQVLVDHSRADNGIRQVTGTQSNNIGLQIVDTIVSYTRAVTGSTEVMTGEILSSGMSGAAIAQLQAQAQEPIEAMKKSFWRFKEKEGKILEQFYRIFYASSDFKYSYKEIVGKNKEIKEEVFNANNIKDVEFTCVAKATSGTRSSSAGDITFLDALLKSGAITIDQYAKAYPEDALSNKDDFIKLIEEAQNNEFAATKQLLAQREQELLKASSYLEDMRKALASVEATNKQNEALRADLAILYKKFIDVTDAGQKLGEMNKELYDDASLFAKELSKGMQTELNKTTPQKQKTLSEEDL